MVKLKSFSGNSIFRSCQTRGFYGKWFPEIVYYQFKRSLRYKTKKEKPHSIVHCSAKKRRNQSNGEGQQTRRRKKKKKGRRRSNLRCQCGGNLMHWVLFKSCISSIFPFSFCTGQISLFQLKRQVYSGTAGIVWYRPVSWAVHFEGVSVLVRRIPAVPASTVRYGTVSTSLIERYHEIKFSRFACIHLGGTDHTSNWH